MTPADDLAQEVIDHRPDLDGYTADEAFEAGVHRAFAALHRMAHSGATAATDGEHIGSTNRDASE